MTEFLDIFDDCLIKVFSYCDIKTLCSVVQTCKRLKLIVDTYHFPKFTAYRSVAGRDNHEVIKHIGRYFRQLSVWFEDTPPRFNIDNYCKLLVKNVGTNIRQLEIVSDGVIIPPLELFVPILKQLDVLELSFQQQRYTEDDWNFYLSCKKTYDMDLAVLCPNLQELIFNGTHRFPPNCSPFTRLKSLRVCCNHLDKYVIDNFLQNNPQLTEVCLYESAGCDQFLNFDNLSQNLVNLETLRIAEPQFRYGSWSPQMLCRLQKLKILRLEIRENFNEILLSVTKMKSLTSISMELGYNTEVPTTCQQSFVQIARELDDLQFFYIRKFPSGVGWDRKTIIEFVRFGSKLRAVCFQRLNFGYSLTFIRDLVVARIAANPNAGALEIDTEDECLSAALNVSSFTIQLAQSVTQTFFFNNSNTGRGPGRGTLYKTNRGAV